MTIESYDRIWYIGRRFHLDIFSTTTISSFRECNTLTLFVHASRQFRDDNIHIHELHVFRGENKNVWKFVSHSSWRGYHHWNLHYFVKLSYTMDKLWDWARSQTLRLKYVEWWAFAVWWWQSVVVVVMISRFFSMTIN